MKVLIIDNYDSFVYNLAQYVGALGASPEVFRNDRITLKQAKALGPDRIIISPGPGNPEDERYFGVCQSVLKSLSKEVPTLGVCLGHQGIGAAFGGKVVRASRLMHGKTSRIDHDGRGVLKGMPVPFEATRYHSLVIDKDTLPDVLRVSALSMDDQEIMGVRHVEYPIEGVQFHPESIMTEDGKRIVRNFLKEGVRQ
ncbi:MAG: aminodeoxychorismate/anthranilate synthase component II [Nitrososphaerota archaeon]|nr:aminodeoxychorismate/anthranilate synthase component II [Nitrososphaerota archaeon]